MTRSSATPILRSRVPATDVAEVLATPIVLLGDIGEIVERLHARYERWRYSYFTIQQTAAREFAPVLARLAA